MTKSSILDVLNTPLTGFWICLWSQPQKFNCSKNFGAFPGKQLFFSLWLYYFYFRFIIVEVSLYQRISIYSVKKKQFWLESFLTCSSYLKYDQIQVCEFSSYFYSTAMLNKWIVCAVHIDSMPQVLIYPFQVNVLLLYPLKISVFRGYRNGTST